MLVSACSSGQAAVGLRAPVQCAPFARAVTGVRLYGPAASWWAAAAGRYARSQVPQAGDLLVFTRSARLPAGHVSVVSAVVSARQILLTQANWLHGRIGVDQPAVDMSARNDWTAVRVWWPPSAAMGRSVYPTYGFIRPDAPLGHDAIAASVNGAVRSVEAGG